jgi:Complex I intermediate-associated protein 30 (CIA30)
MGGVSMARLTREMFDGRLANVLRGSVKMDNNGGFIQMATNLQRDGTSVDVSAFDGVELLVQSGSAQMESFNVQ